MSNNINLNDNNWIDIVFQNRNKEYGAYQIRKNYNRNSILSIVGMFSFLGLAFGVIVLFSSFKDFIADQPDDTNKLDTFYIIMPEIEPIEEEPEAPAPAVEKSELSKSIRFTEPEIVPDQKVPDELLPPTEKELEGNVIATTTEEGKDENPNINTPVETDGGTGTAQPEIGITADKMPMFPGGEQALLKYIADHSTFTPIARENNVTGTIYVSFIVNEKGEVISAKVERGIGFGMDEMVLNVIKNLPDFSPAENKGHPVKIKMMVPVRFELK